VRHRSPLFTVYRSLFTVVSGMLTVTFLGTGAACPSIERNVAALALAREGETLLFDCGEGTQGR